MNKKAQNIVEYILLVVAVILVCIIFLRRHGPMEQGVSSTLNGMTYRINHLDESVNFTP